MCDEFVCAEPGVGLCQADRELLHSLGRPGRNQQPGTTLEKEVKEHKEEKEEVKDQKEQSEVKEDKQSDNNNDSGETNRNLETDVGDQPAGRESACLQQSVWMTVL